MPRGTHTIIDMAMTDVVDDMEMKSMNAVGENEILVAHNLKLL
jgi:hypothetical protein